VLLNIYSSIQPCRCGNCVCGTCPVHVDPEWLEKLPQVVEDETAALLFSPYEKNATTRLSCQITFTDELDGLRVTLSVY
jgi:ferredoxin, 2Fe-2S